MDAEGQLTIWRGRRDGTLGDPATEDLTAGEPGYGIALGRFDEGSTLDLVAPLKDTHDILLAPGSGSGSFGPATSFDAANTQNGIVAADLNLDGELDVATGRADGGFDLAFGNGEGGFSFATSFTGDGVESTWLEVARLDRNSRPDLLLGTREDLRVYLNEPDV